MIPAPDFFVPQQGGPKQGDILLAGVARLVGPDLHVPPAWRSLDLYDVYVEPEDGPRPLRIFCAPALVMVTSHDCHFDKEWNIRRRVLLRSGHSEADAERIADEDLALDRSFNASPLVKVDDVGRDRKALLAGKIVGYLPVPASSDGLIPETVVDLSYRVTLDRLDVSPVASVSEPVRAQLRYSLARMESLRATKLGFDVEQAIGRRIEEVTVERNDPLLVRLHLDNGSTLELLQHPDSPPPGPARSAWDDSAA